MKHYNVVAAVIEYNGKYLCMQRNYSKFPYTSYKFEFPGGKIEAGETKPQALMRELREEMEMFVDIAEGDYLMTVEHEYPDFEITLHCYVVHVSSPEFVLKEHKSFVWLSKDKLNTLDWADADADVIKKLME